MSILKRLFGSAGQSSKPRVRICVECGMPVAEHKAWCSILRGQAEMRDKATTSARAPKPQAVQDPTS
jgi:hypothetical protein